MFIACLSLNVHSQSFAVRRWGGQMVLKIVNGWAGGWTQDLLGPPHLESQHDLDLDVFFHFKLFYRGTPHHHLMVCTTKPIPSLHTDLFMRSIGSSSDLLRLPQH